MKNLKKVGLLDLIKSLDLQLRVKKLKKNRIIFNSSFNENYNFNSKFLFEYFIEQLKGKNYEIKFIINNQELKDKLEKVYGNYFIETSTRSNIKYILEAKTWIVSTIDPPIIELFKNKNRIIYHLGHGIPLKNIILAEKKISILKKINRFLRIKNYTHSIATSEFMVPIIKKAFGNKKIKVVVKGQPRNDYLTYCKNENNYMENSNRQNKINILYCPTWRSYEKTKIFPFVDYNLEKMEKFLKEKDICIFIKSHPYYDIEYDINLKKSKMIKFIDNNIKEITPYLDFFSFLITDYSSIYLDFLILNKPIIYIPYDYERYLKEVGFSFDYIQNTPGPKVFTQENFIEEINKYLKNKTYYELERKKINQKLNKYTSNNCKMNFEYIMWLLEKVGD